MIEAPKLAPMSHLVPSRVATGLGGAATTPHELSTLAAIEIMSGGGNAVDAAIAANAVQGVVAPETCGIGGDLFALIYEPGAEAPTCINASGRAGSRASAAALRDAGHTTMPLLGPASITVPGCVDGWYSLLEWYGTRSLADVLAPALRYATEGFAASTELSRAWTRRADQLLTQKSAPSMFPDGRPPGRGEHLRRPLLAESLHSIIAGRNDFYVDRIGPGVVEASAGAITLEDLARNQAEWVEPLSMNVFDRTAWTVPPNTQGYLTLAALGIFEMLGSQPTPPTLITPTPSSRAIARWSGNVTISFPTPTLLRWRHTIWSIQNGCERRQARSKWIGRAPGRHRLQPGRDRLYVHGGRVRHGGIADPVELPRDRVWDICGGHGRVVAQPRRWIQPT